MFETYNLFNDSGPGACFGCRCDCQLGLFDAVIIFIITVLFWEAAKFAYRKVYKQEEEKK